MKKNKDNSLPLVVICGPTAVGKSELALNLALRLNGEIVNADSRQIFKGMDIGTAKPSTEKRNRIPHHLLDIREPGEGFSAGEFSELADEVLTKIAGRNKIPFVVGGSGLYIKALLEGLFEGPEKDEELRRELNELREKKSLSYLYKILAKTDPESAERIDSEDTYRIIRALEVCFLTGKKMSELLAQEEKKYYRPLKIGLKTDRENLYKRIEKRVDEMLADGFVDEVKALLENGVNKDCYAFDAIGYTEAVDYLKNEISLEDLKNSMKKRTRNYAKRQITWFKKDEDIKWFSIEEKNLENKAYNYISENLNG